MLKTALSRFTHRIYQLPVLVLMPHSSCNCRCVMCDIWKSNQHKKEISTEELQKHISDFKKLKVREVALSGGEALMHSNLWKFCQLLKQQRIKISLLSTGLLLKKFSEEILNNVDEVIVSLDGSPDVHNKIRNIPSAYEKLAEGINSLKSINSTFPVKGRTVLQKQNFTDFLNVIKSAKDLGLDQISFLGADVSTEAFNRPQLWDENRVSDIALSDDEVKQFEEIVRMSFVSNRSDYDSKFIAESPSKMLQIIQYYSALTGKAEFPVKRCNAPWVSAVIESDGEVKPCFFHASYGNINDNSFLSLLNSSKAIAFRKNLNMTTDMTCKKCVCSLYLRPTLLG